MAGIPPIKVRGVRQSIPSGYILGRRSPGVGDVELIPNAVLAQSLVSTGIVASPNTPAPPGTSTGSDPAAASNAKKALALAGYAFSLDPAGGEGTDGPPGKRGATGGGGGGGTDTTARTMAKKASALAGIGTTIDTDDAPSEAPPGLNNVRTTAGLVFAFDGNGAAPPANSTVDLYVPFACTIIAATTLADVSGSCVLDIWVKAFSTSSPPAVGQTITAAALPTLSTATGANDTTLTGWTTSIPAGSMVRVNVNSASILTRIVLTLTVLKK